MAEYRVFLNFCPIFRKSLYIKLVMYAKLQLANTRSAELELEIQAELELELDKKMNRVRHPVHNILHV